MQLHVDDDGFVRAPAPQCYRALTDIGAWQRWWPGMRLEAVEAPDETWAITMRDRGLRLRFRAVPGQYRLDTGFCLRLEGDLTGTAEFWLERGWGGTVVHHLLVAETSRRRHRRVLGAYRRVLRRGLWAFKDTQQQHVRDAAGLDR